MYPLKLEITDNLDRFVKLLEDWRSGEEVAKLFGISRNAVWKRIQRLKEMGFEVEAKKGKGYRIRKSPEFSVISILEALKNAKAERVVRRVYYYTETDSTNERAKILEAGSLILAERQLAGKGRLGREWVSEKGGLYFSIVLEPNLSIEDVPKLTLTAGVAVAEALANFRARLKWPNDILIDGKKVCGILSEISGEVERPKIIIGIGINVKNPVPNGAVNLQAYGEISLVDIFERVVASFVSYYAELLSGEWDRIKNKWIEFSDTIGKRVRVSSSGKTYVGRAIGLADDGGLLLESEGTIKKIYSGDCFYIGPNNF